LVYETLYDEMMGFPKDSSSSEELGPGMPQAQEEGVGGGSRTNEDPTSGPRVMPTATQ